MQPAGEAVDAPRGKAGRRGAKQGRQGGVAPHFCLPGEGRAQEGGKLRAAGKKGLTEGGSGGRVEGRRRSERQGELRASPSKGNGRKACVSAGRDGGKTDRKGITQR